MTERDRYGATQRQAIAVPDLGPVGRDVDSLKPVTGWITCRLVDEHALLHCKRCATGERVGATPRPEFLSAVRAFLRAHDDCSA